MSGQNIEVIDKYNYLEVVLNRTGGWNKQKTVSSSSIYRHMCVGNPQYKDRDIGEYIRNGM
jgi:hypothetical protein